MPTVLCIILNWQYLESQIVVTEGEKIERFSGKLKEMDNYGATCLNLHWDGITRGLQYWRLRYVSA